MIALIYVCNVLCSAGQSAFTKQYAKKKGSSVIFNVNKALMGTALFLVMGLLSGFSLNIPTILFGTCYGLSLYVSMIAGFKALSMGPMALTSVISSFYSVIPFIAGICFWNEALTPYKVTGIILVLFSILLINAKKENGFSYKWLVYTIICLTANGVCAIIQKMHQLEYPKLYRTEFMFWALLCVLIILSVVMFGKPAEKRSFKFSFLGLTSGFLNCSANFIVLYLSSTENASELFPIVSIANIMAVWATGVVFFKEKLKLFQTIGLIVGVASVVLLKL